MDQNRAITSPTIVPQMANLTPEQVNATLPAALKTALERGWYDHIDFARYPATAFVKYSRDDLRRASRFLQVQEVTSAVQDPIRLQMQHMQNVISSMRDGSHSLVYALTSGEDGLRLLTGVRKLGESHPETSDYIEILYRALRSNFPGILLKEKSAEEGPYTQVSFDKIRLCLINEMMSARYLACLTGIPALRRADDPDSFVTQTIDHLADALRGEQYTLMILAEPIDDPQVNRMIDEMRRLGEEVHLLVRQSVTLSRNRSETHSESTSDTATVQLGGGQILAAIFGISVGQSWSRGTADGSIDGMGASMTQERLNKTAQFCEQVLDHYTTRLQNGRSLGFWNVGIYLASQDPNTALRLQGITKSLYAGQNSYFEPLRVLDLSSAPPPVREALGQLRNPSLNYLLNLTEPDRPIKHPLGLDFQSLGTPLTTEELSILVNFPSREVPGLRRKIVADFHLNPPQTVGPVIGSLVYRGEKLPQRVAISPNSLTRHTFVTGLTGSGKTNTCLALLSRAYREDHLRFLVVDPAKTEYRFLLNDPLLKDKLLLFTLGDEDQAPFRLNPFEFVRGFPLLTHIDLIKAVFNAAFPMYASMPYLLEEALLEVYQERGWDMATSCNRYIDANDPAVDRTPFIPRLSDLYAKVDDVVSRKRYGSQVGQDLSAALKARLSSLLVGSKGLMLDTPRSIDIQTLLSHPVVIELRRLGDDDEKAFIMALIFVMLYEACQLREISRELRHVTLFEEAHRLLRNVPAVASAESANPRGKTVEMFTDMMAEMRAHGEGFIVVDQMPAKLVPDVIKGSNLKIIHRLMAGDDRQAVGQSMALTQAQIDYLPRLAVGQAVMHSEELEEACLVQIDPVEDDFAHQSTTDLVESVRARAKAFYNLSPDLLRRFSACEWCDAPCAYQPDQHRPPEETIAGTVEALTLLACGSESKAVQVLESTAQLLAGSVPERRCMAAQVAAQTVRRFIRSYAKPINGQLLGRLETQLAGALLESRVADSLGGLGALLRGAVCLAPALARSGCTRCRQRCRFVCRFRADHIAVRQVTAVFKSVTSAQPIDAQKLIRLVSQRTAGQVEESLLVDATYCVLTQATEDEAPLNQYISQTWGKL